MPTDTSAPSSPAPEKRRYVRAIGPRLRILLWCIFGLMALLGANSVYLSGITFLEWRHGLTYQNYFYQIMFLAHLALGLLIVVPFIIFGIGHIRNAHDRPNRRAVRVGYALFTCAIVLLGSGFALMRIGDFKIQDPAMRSGFYWAHVLTPLGVVWLYVLHRLAGPRIKWAAAGRWAVAFGVLIAAMIYLNAQDPRAWGRIGSAEGVKYFEPSLARTATGDFIPAKVMMSNEYCQQCHQDVYDGWYHSVHRFSSFNNPAYLFSIKETREVSLKRDGNVKASRWCAGCHDPVPFFSGAFDDPNFDLENHATAKAGITCVSCHAITNVNSTRGNADYTIEEPIFYPFTFSENGALQAINRQLVKAKPEFHKKTFLKPAVHRNAEFCSTCHKVSLPFAVTHYKEFLRGQNHYDSFLLSGVSGGNARAFYYPPKTKENCATCHMPLVASEDFGAKRFDPAKAELQIHDHLFPGANTAIAHLRGEQDIVARQQKMLEGCVRVDIFGVRAGGKIDGKLTAPIRPDVPALQPGQTYLVEVVLRTLTLGHLFTQGTVDSNEAWVDVTVKSGDQIVGRSGGLGPARAVDPWAYFANVFMLDREGRRIDRRNAQDIFTPLYNHQIPPGAARVVHYALTVPPDQREPLVVEAKFQYRKFDTIYMQHIYGPETVNELPITTMATDRVVFPIEGGVEAVENPPSPIEPTWQRWNDYGIALLIEGDEGSLKGELVQAAGAFAEVEKMQRPDGPLNMARVFVKEGRLEDAAGALTRALAMDPPAPRWTVAWLNGLVNKQNGNLKQAETEFRSILEDRFPERTERGLKFENDYEVINELGLTLFELAKLERGDARRAARDAYLEQAVEQFQKTLALDSENVTAHYNLAQIYSQLGKTELAEQHRGLHERFRPDNNARDRAIEIARRRDQAADHAAQSIAIYPLHRVGAPELPITPTALTQAEAKR
ncbi:MAG: tetratricopeptide repeat protein [Chthoniobacteraceae bacterium]